MGANAGGYPGRMDQTIAAALQELRPGLEAERLAEAVALWRHWFGSRMPDDAEAGVLAAFLARLDGDGLTGARV